MDINIESRKPAIEKEMLALKPIRSDGYIKNEDNLAVMLDRFADLKQSERAAVLSAQYDTLKKKSGYRSDLLIKIRNLPVPHWETL